MYFNPGVILWFQLPEGHTSSSDNISQFSVDSITSTESKEPVFIAAGDIRYRVTVSQNCSASLFLFKRFLL